MGRIIYDLTQVYLQLWRLCGLLFFVASPVFYYSIWLRSMFFSECVRGHMYAVGHPSHDHFLLNHHPKIFSSSSQLDKMLKLISERLIPGSVHTSSAPPFTLIVKPRNTCLPYDFAFLFYSFNNCSGQIWRIMYYLTYWLFTSHPYDNSFSRLFCIKFSQYNFYLACVFSVEITCLGDSTDRIGIFFSFF